MRVLILGGTGVISTGITQQLLDRGDDVTLFNRGTSDRGGLDNAKTVIGSRQSAEDLRRAATGGFDAVIDMICYRPDDGRIAIDTFRGATPQYVFCSTVDVFTAPADVYPITEGHPRNPSLNFPYAFQKAELERMFEAAAATGAFGLTILRPAATYLRNIVPPIGSTALYLELLRTGRPLVMHGDGTALWVATHRDDVARGFVAALRNPKAIGRSYNLQSEEFLTWERYWTVAAEAIGAPTPHFVHIPTDVLVRMLPKMAEWCALNFQHHNVISSEAARRDLGFNPQISWKQGAAALVSLTDRPDPEMIAKYERLLATWHEATDGLRALE